MTYFSASRSYTGQDVVELSCHGSPVVVERVLEELAAAGSRPADPGEFTYRAVLNERMDIAQAEGVRDLIEAATRSAAGAAARQVRGDLSRRIENLRERLVEMICRAEAAVEFAEEPDVVASPLRLAPLARALRGDVSAFAATWSLGRRLREGATVVIAGRPNSGKSSLFNIMLGTSRAIVSAEPGTTRDYLSEPLDIEGIPVRLVDTAGLRRAPHDIERQGVEMARSWLQRADLVLLLCPVDQPFDEEEDIPPDCAARAVIVASKCDLPAPAGAPPDPARVPVSSVTGEGLGELRARIARELTQASSLPSDDLVVTNARHHAALESCAAELSRAISALDDGMTEEVALAGLHAALGHLTEITRPLTRDEMHDRIFSTFCVGK